MKTKCSKCENKFVMGMNGTFGKDGNIPTCDNCSGVERDKNGYIWFPDEKESTFMNVETDEEFTITREEAFSKEY
jgi:NAD-dependent SIR2 family protein deacetylase